MKKTEARELVQCCVWRVLTEDGKWLFQELIGGPKAAKDNDEIRNAIKDEIEFLRKRALNRREGVYGRYRDFVERVYETRVDCRLVPGEAR